ncbi:hypothetical protein RhiirC2_781277 [Rhizophagus irregularis]|uniref:Uncharacterized protein n=1 Tax=Rhizophagus irregularis TaxID=588596 RepID=A0A2N1N5U7_9GLOM|nr:hypothetical protein RhiirC2_781277 [Rhizophagus irregularis]
MWDLLDDPDQKILANFVRACYLLVSCIIDESKLTEAHNRLLKVAQLIKNIYEPEMITPNIYLSLHISECCQDYGPLYSFWCYSFKRMNGLLGSFPNSHRQIEPELLRIIMQNWRLDDLISNQLNNSKLVEELKLKEQERFQVVLIGVSASTTIATLYTENPAYSILTPIGCKAFKLIQDRGICKLITYYANLDKTIVKKKPPLEGENTNTIKLDKKYKKTKRAKKIDKSLDSIDKLTVLADIRSMLRKLEVS